MNKGIVLGIVFLFVCMSFTSISSYQIKNQTIKPSIRGNILYVGGNGEGNYTKIQDAIDNASDGDTVFVYDDSSPYYENVKVYKSISLIGENKNSTIISHEVEWDPIVNLTADGIILKSFTIDSFDNGYGVYGVKIYSSYNNVTDLCIKNNYWGILCINSELGHNIFVENIFYNNDNGLLIRECNYNKIIGNYFNNRGLQFGLQWADFNNISDNTFSQIGNFLYSYGLMISPGSDNVVIDNNFLKCGLQIDRLSHRNEILNNTVNGKTLVYMEGESNIILSEIVGQVIINDCTNITIKNQELSNVSHGIIILDSKDCILIDNTIKYTVQGIIISYSDDSIISKNNISYSHQSLLIKYCNYLSINQNNIFDGWHAIELISCNNTFVKDNTIKNNLYVSCIELIYTSNCFIIKNKIFNNARGILINHESKNNRIYNNDIRNNMGYGICFSDDSDNNNILGNNFISNKPNAYFVQNLNNYWNGNFWNRFRFLPKIIFGYKDDSSIFPSYFNIDWFPAKEPYDITIAQGCGIE